MAGDGDEENEGGRFFLESRKKQRTCVVDGKAAGIKLKGRVAVCPVAGKILRCLVWSKLRPVIPSLFPFGRATHALASSCAVRCHGCDGWARKLDAAGSGRWIE